MTRPADARGSHYRLGPGSLLGERYRLEKELGSGGMGAVYLAEHLALGRTLAVKVLHPHVAMAPNAAERFQREARILAKLNHQNAVEVYDFGFEDGVLYIAMELLKGQPLDTMVRESWSGVELERAVKICSQALDVLEVAHGLGIIHRDLKPANVFIESPGTDDRVKVVDFGLALMVDEPGKSRLTEAGMVHGTPEYMAPEQCLGQNVDGRADLYALGCVLWEMIAGTPPFGFGQAMQVMTAHVYKPLPNITEVAPAYLMPPTMVEVIERALAKRPEDRFQDARSMREALWGAVSSPPSSPRGAHKVHVRGPAVASDEPTRLAGQHAIGLLAPGGRELVGPGVAEALGTGGYVVRKLTADSSLDGLSAVVVLPPASDNGLAIASQLARSSQGVPVLLCGSDEDLTLVTQAIESGVHDFVALPLDPSELLKKVNRAVRKKRAGR